MSHFFGCSFKQPTDESTDQRSPPCGHVIIPLSALSYNDAVPECPLKTENDQNPSAAPPLPSEVSRDTIAICARSKITSLYMRSSPAYSTVDHFCSGVHFADITQRGVSLPWQGGGRGLFFFACGGNQLGAAVVQQAVTLVVAGPGSH